jgi:hypothetical protein
MLDAHPVLAIPPETAFIPHLAGKCRESEKPAKTFIRKLTAFYRWDDFHLDPGELASRVTAIHPFDFSEALRAFYRLYAETQGKCRWGDKTPPYIDSLKIIYPLLPEARFVHIIRDGRDVALSVSRLWFGPNSVVEAADWWASKIRKARHQAEALPYYLEVRYEDMLADPATVLRRICSFIDLPWDPAMLTFHERAQERIAELDAPVRSADGVRIVSVQERLSALKLVTEPPRRDRIGRWRTEMTREDRHAFEEIAGELLCELGYETQ